MAYAKTQQEGTIWFNEANLVNLTLRGISPHPVTKTSSRGQLGLVTVPKRRICKVMFLLSLSGLVPLEKAVYHTLSNRYQMDQKTSVHGGKTIDQSASRGGQPEKVLRGIYYSAPQTFSRHGRLAVTKPPTHFPTYSI